MKFLVFVRGLLLGGLVGAAAGLLLAPEPGNDLQARIRKWYEEAVEDGRTAAAERRQELEAQLAEAKRAAR